MTAKVTQVSRTYRTQALWYAAEDAWKQANRSLGQRSPKTSAAAVPSGDRFSSYARAAAISLADVLASAQKLRHSGDRLTAGTSHGALQNRNTEPILSGYDTGTPPAGTDTEQIKREVQELVDRYNGLHGVIHTSIPPLKNGSGDRIVSRLDGLSLNEFGIKQNADGALIFNAGALEEQAAVNYSRLRRNLGGPDGLAAALTGAAEQLLSQPADQLLDKRQGVYRSYANYRLQAWDAGPPQPYLPMPLTGLLLNSYF